MLITGVNRGIGAALLAAFAGGGWDVIGWIRPGRTVQLSALAETARERVEVQEVDFDTSDGLTAAAAQISRPLDVLISNAATFGGNAFFARDFDPGCMQAAFWINTTVPALIARLLRPRLLEGTRKLIVMMSTGNASITGNNGGEMFAYRASKSALNQVTRTIAVEWAGDGITAVALNPGWVRTDMGGPNAPMSPQQAASEILGFCLGDTKRLSGRFVNTNTSELPW